MKITEMANLYVGYNEKENIKVLICAINKEEAEYVAEDYKFRNDIEGNFVISTYDNVETEFDYDYVLTYTPIVFG